MPQNILICGGTTLIKKHEVENMLTTIMFIIIGIWLKAPVWWYFLCGIVFFLKLFKYGIDMYRIGCKKIEREEKQ